jgi:hypothetical protein
MLILIFLNMKTDKRQLINCNKAEKLHPFLCSVIRARTFKCVWGPGIDSKERIPPAYVEWRAGTKTLFLLGA